MAVEIVFNNPGSQNSYSCPVQLHCREDEKQGILSTLKLCSQVGPYEWVESNANSDISCQAASATFSHQTESTDLTHTESDCNEHIQVKSELCGCDVCQKLFVGACNLLRYEDNRLGETFVAMETKCEEEVAAKTMAPVSNDKFSNITCRICGKELLEDKDVYDLAKDLSLSSFDLDQNASQQFCVACLMSDVVNSIHEKCDVFDDVTQCIEYECSLCMAVFLSRTEIRKHIDTHNRIQNHACPFCDQQFSDGKEFYAHFISHEKKQEFTCRLCKKVFTCESIYQFHVKSHRIVDNLRQPHGAQRPIDVHDRKNANNHTHAMLLKGNHDITNSDLIAIETVKAVEGSTKRLCKDLTVSVRTPSKGSYKESYDNSMVPDDLPNVVYEREVYDASFGDYSGQHVHPHRRTSNKDISCNLDRLTTSMENVGGAICLDGNRVEVGIDENLIETGSEGQGMRENDRVETGSRGRNEVDDRFSITDGKEWERIENVQIDSRSEVEKEKNIFKSVSQDQERYNDRTETDTEEQEMGDSDHTEFVNEGQEVGDSDHTEFGNERQEEADSDHTESGNEGQEEADSDSTESGNEGQEVGEDGHIASGNEGQEVGDDGHIASGGERQKWQNEELEKLQKVGYEENTSDGSHRIKGRTKESKEQYRVKENSEEELFILSRKKFNIDKSKKIIIRKTLVIPKSQSAVLSQSETDNNNNVNHKQTKQQSCDRNNNVKHNKYKCHINQPNSKVADLPYISYRSSGKDGNGNMALVSNFLLEEESFDQVPRFLLPEGNSKSGDQHSQNCTSSKPPRELVSGNGPRLGQLERKMVRDACDKDDSSSYSDGHLSSSDGQCEWTSDGQEMLSSGNSTLKEPELSSDFYIGGSEDQEYSADDPDFNREHLQYKYCSKIFQRKSNLSLHVSIHEGKGPFKCNICNKSCQKRGDLKKHLTIHTGDRPFSCSICQMSFSQCGNLHRHMTTHTDRSMNTNSTTRMFSCDLCDKRFIQKAHMVRHRRVHTGERSHTCDKCGETFFENRDLKRHLQKHKTGKHMKCTVCGETYTRRLEYNRHLRTHELFKDY